MPRPALLITVAFCLVSMTAAASDDLFVTLQVRPDIKPATLRRLAGLLETESHHVEEDTWSYQILRKEYGSSHFKLRDLFAAYNEGATQLEEGDMVTLPPAPEWAFNVELTVPEAMTLKEFIESEMGVAGPRTLKAVAKASGLTEGALSRLEPGAKIVLPYVSSVASYRVKPGVENVEAAIEELKRADDAIELLEVSPQLRLIPSVQLATSSASCPNAAIPAGRHCDVEDLGRYTSAKPTILAILDSGVPSSESRFSFWKNPVEAAGQRWKDDDKNRYVDDIIGTDMIAGGGWPRDDVNSPSLKNHGTHVAGLASCRTASDAHKALVNERVHLMILKVATADGRIRPDAVADAVSYATRNNANIVNMSFESPRYQLAVHDFIERSSNVLFVAAAGNGVDSFGRDLKDFDVYPAKLSADLPNLMSVAAHDANGKRTCFSNYGYRNVDIAAPGLGVRSTIAGGESELSGTSQAAPLVAAAAALLHSHGVDDPKKIRERLVLSADFSEHLRGEVRSEGVLNVAKALAYTDDIVRTKDAIHYGTLTSFAGIDTPAGLVPANAIRKVINGYSAVPGHRVKIITNDAERELDAAIPDLVITKAGVPTPIRGADVIEIIPRMR